jgi:hypothetical protein
VNVALGEHAKAREQLARALAHPGGFAGSEHARFLLSQIE